MRLRGCVGAIQMLEGPLLILPPWDVLMMQLQHGLSLASRVLHLIPISNTAMGRAAPPAWNRNVWGGLAWTSPAWTSLASDG